MDSKSASTPTSPVPMTPRCGKWGTLYCVLCSACKHKTTSDGVPITLYSIPNGKSEEQQQRRAKWISKIRTVRVDKVNFNKSTRLCSQHFVHVDPRARDSVPDRLILSSPPPSAPKAKRRKLKKNDQQSE